MQLGELAAAIGLTVPGDAARMPIEALAIDSRTVQPGTLFAALPGSRTDGSRFIADAVGAGAAAILAADGTPWPEGVPERPMLRHPEPARALALLAAEQAGPQPERIVAVTGTNGKTSTAEFLRQFWEMEGVPAASIGTLGVNSPISLRTHGPSLTTPDSIALARLLAELAQGGVRAASIEASSHGLSQHRLDGVRVAAAGFSNLTRDHLDYHRTLAQYRCAKLRLFADLLPQGAVACANADMDTDTLADLRAITERRGQPLRLVGEGGDAIRLLRARPLPDGQVLEIEALGSRREIVLALPGRFQADNVLLAAALAEDALDALDRTLQRAPRLVGVRGRMERAARLDDGAAAYVDYAHTPDALERLLQSLRPHALGRLVLVFGAGGDRDRGKRPLMGAVAARLADLVIVTDDNPRSEPPAAIRAEILAACPDAIEIGDRAAAIAAGLEAVHAGDVLVVAGKGHEQGQTIGGQTLPFDDRAVIRRLAGLQDVAA
jgi:UDP-N-acetylmuramoyl-L-alanyl-D-glutamate--2,6-diaminopimelate ligase